MVQQTIVDCSTGAITVEDVPEDQLLTPTPAAQQLAEAKAEVNQMVDQAIALALVSTAHISIALRYTQNVFLYREWVAAGSPETPDATIFASAYTEAAIYAEALAGMSSDNPLYEQYERCSTPAKIVAEWGRQAHLMDVASSQPFMAQRRAAMIRLDALMPETQDIEGAIQQILADLRQNLP